MIDRPDVLPPDAYVRAVRDQALADLIGRASAELNQPLVVVSLAVVRDRVPEGDYGGPELPVKGKGKARPGHARVRFHETIDKRRFLFELEARFAPDATNPAFAGFSVEGQVRDPGDGRLVAEFRNWEMSRGPSHWSEPFETVAERHARFDVPAHWEVRTDAGDAGDAGDLGSLLSHLRRRYGLEGGYVATADGNVIAQDGQLDVGEVPGLVPLLSHDRATIQSFMAMVTIPLMPYSARAGQWMAWFAVPSPSLFVVLLRRRPREAEQPDDWGTLSEPTELAERRVAERMLFELRDLVAALGYQLTRSP